MEEQLIDFETAKLAKEKGFILSRPLYLYDENGEILDLKRSFDLARQTFILDITTILAPTQSLLQKWLREVHGFYIEVMVSNRHIPTKGLIYSFIVIQPDLSENRNIINHVAVSKEPSDSYEEALEVGLLEGLKLIQ